MGIRVGLNWPKIISCDWYFVVCFTTLAVSLAETLRLWLLVTVTELRWEVDVNIALRCMLFFMSSTLTSVVHFFCVITLQRVSAVIRHLQGAQAVTD